MSVQFGRWNFEGQQPSSEYIAKVKAVLAPHGPDSNETYSNSGVNIFYRAFHTTTESRRETQPHACPCGAIITWDGRLDNRAELVGDLRDSVTSGSTDVEIVAAAFQRWGDKCFGRLIGDWALSVWNPRERCLLLAKDPIGTKHLYYSFDEKQLTWSTILDPLVLFAGEAFELCEEYIAGWFAIPPFPAAHLTPYVGIHAVPPSSCVFVRPGKHVVSRYWDFDPGKRIRYRTDAEYEEHFRAALTTAVERRLRSDRPVLAELSGGMDSSSIVCVADTIIARGAAACPRLDTISWYDDSYDHIEPDWNEYPFFTKVEEKRGRTGCHINTGRLPRREPGDGASRKSFDRRLDGEEFMVFPSASSPRSDVLREYAAHMKSVGHRVTLSGIGGDETTGNGVPTPTPELQNLIVRGRFFTLNRQLKRWAERMRKPRFLLLREAVRGFFPAARGTVSKEMRFHGWLDSDFIRRNRVGLSGYPSRVRLFGSLPTYQEHLANLYAFRRFLASRPLSSEFLREVRYPYLDRDFLEFAYAVPRDQIVRVGQRRSLMKRALIGIVPPELLRRRRKAFVPPQAAGLDSEERTKLTNTNEDMLASSIRIIDPIGIREALQQLRRKEPVPIDILGQTLTLLSWLEHLKLRGILRVSMSTPRQGFLPVLEGKKLESSVESKSSAS